MPIACKLCQTITKTIRAGISGNKIEIFFSVILAVGIDGLDVVVRAAGRRPTRVAGNENFFDEFGLIFCAKTSLMSHLLTGQQLLVGSSLDNLNVGLLIHLIKPF